MRLACKVSTLRALGVGSPFRADHSVGACAGDPADCPLGSGGPLTLEFTDNFLTGSDSPDLDLWIFEVGPDVEDTFVEISMEELSR